MQFLDDGMLLRRESSFIVCFVSIDDVVDSYAAYLRRRPSGHGFEFLQSQYWPQQNPLPLWRPPQVSRWVGSAAIASSILRVNFEPGLTIRYLALPKTGDGP
jgi:hypothetical protein